MFRIIRSPNGKAPLRTAPQGKNRPHLLPGDHAGAPGKGDDGERVHFCRRRETAHRGPHLSTLRQAKIGLGRFFSETNRIKLR